MTALEKVTDILELFLKSNEELSLAEISRLTGLNKSTAYRIASFLTKKGYLKQIEKRGKYSLGMKFLDFNTVIKDRIAVRSIASRYLYELRNTIQESCGLVIWDGHTATLIDTFLYNSTLRASPSEVSKLPLHATSAGKIFLANMTDEQLNRYLSQNRLEKFTPKTIVDPVYLKKQLEIIRQEKIAYDIDEHIVGITSIGLGIRDFKGNINSAVAVIAPSARLTSQKIKEITPVVREYTLNISKELGWKEDYL